MRLINPNKNKKIFLFGFFKEKNSNVVLSKTNTIFILIRQITNLFSLQKDYIKLVASLKM